MRAMPYTRMALSGLVYMVRFDLVVSIEFKCDFTLLPLYLLFGMKRGQCPTRSGYPTLRPCVHVTACILSAG